MTLEKEFNNKIKSFLKNQPNSSASDTIKLISKLYPINNFYSAFDSLGTVLGLNFSIHPIENSKGTKIIGYTSSISYSFDNKFNKKGTEEFNTIMKLKDCSKFIAKEVLYRFMQIRNLEKIINEKLNIINK